MITFVLEFRVSSTPGTVPWTPFALGTIPSEQYRAATPDLLDQAKAAIPSLESYDLRVRVFRKVPTVLIDTARTVYGLPVFQVVADLLKEKEGESENDESEPEAKG